MEKQKDVFITLNDKEVKLPKTFKERFCGSAQVWFFARSLSDPEKQLSPRTLQQCTVWDYCGFRSCLRYVKYLLQSV